MRPGRYTRAQVLLAIGALGIGVALWFQYSGFYHDDAYISLRYVRNFLDGNGLGWNPGDRVEGYSNFLMVLVVAALGRVGIDLVVASQIVGGASLAGLGLFALSKIMRTTGPSPRADLSTIPSIVTITCMPLIIWSLSGMETALFALLTTAGSVVFAQTLTKIKKSLLPAGVLLGLAALCRPDGILFVASGVVFAAVCGLVKRESFAKRVTSLAGGSLALIVPHLVWRYTYYGDWLPNTYYVKATNLGSVAATGWGYFKEYALAAPFVPVIVLIALAWGLLRKAVSESALWYLTVTVVYLGYVIAIGGDHMPAFRLIAPVVPLCGFLIYELLAAEHSAIGRFAASMIAVAVLGLCAAQIKFPAEKYRRARVMDGAAYLGGEVGRWINTNWPEGSTVALNTAGSTPYFAPKLRFVDMLGLNDATIARRNNVPIRTKMQQWPGHGKGDGVYVLSRKPDYVIIGPANGDYIHDFPWFLSDYELEGSAEFEQKYQPVKAYIPCGPGYENYTESAAGTLRFVYYQRRK